MENLELRIDQSAGGAVIDESPHVAPRSGPVTAHFIADGLVTEDRLG